MRPAWRAYISLLGIFYGLWVSHLVIHDSWTTLTDNWPIAVAMAMGSFVAGATPMGGGTVGFPVLVLGFEFPATLGRDFSFAIQSVGMVSAAAFIAARRQVIEWNMLRPALVGSVVGTPLGLLVIAPLIPSLVVKVTFAVLWASFGVFQLVRRRALIEGSLKAHVDKSEQQLGFGVGFFGSALIASLTGVGVDMLLYIALVLRCGTEVAIPTSVILMALTSLVGVTIQFVFGRLTAEIAPLWMSAAPVVALGAPLGALTIEKLPRSWVLGFVSTLCLLQFVWTMLHEYDSLGISGILLSLVGWGGALLCLHAAQPTEEQREVTTLRGRSAVVQAE